MTIKAEARLNRTHYLVLILILLGCLTRFFMIGRESLWFDEIASIDIAHRIGFLHLEKHVFFSGWEESHPLFYYLILYFWIKLFGIGETAIRSLSAIFGVLLILSTYYVGRKLISKEAGMIAAILLLLNPVAVYYSQEARMYTIIPLLILFSTYYFYKLLTSPSKKHFVLYICASVLLIYSDYLGALLLTAHFLFTLLWFSKTRGKGGLLTVACALFAILLLYIPWLPNALVRHNWGLIAWMSPPSLSKTVRVALHLLGIDFLHPGNFTVLSVSSLRGMVHVLLGIWGLSILAVGFWVSVKELKTPNALVAFLCLMPLVFVVISIVKMPIFNLRQASLYLPEIMLTMAIGLLAIASYVRKRLGTLCPPAEWLWLIAPLLVAGIFSMYRVYAVDTKENWRALAADVQEFGDHRPIYICRWYQVPSLKYYYKGSSEITGVKYEEIQHFAQSVTAREIIFVTAHVDSSKILDVLRPNFVVQKESLYRGPEVFFLQKID